MLHCELPSELFTIDNGPIYYMFIYDGLRVTTIWLKQPIEDDPQAFIIEQVDSIGHSEFFKATDPHEWKAVCERWVEKETCQNGRKSA